MGTPLRSPARPDVWSETDGETVTVHAPGVILRAPAAPPDPELVKIADRIRAAYAGVGTADRADLDTLAAAAFDGQAALLRLDHLTRLVCLSHVLKTWGVPVLWR